MRNASLLGALAACFLLGCQSTAPSQTPASVLPLRTVRLYETGVGYFERSGSVSGDEQATLPVPAGHLDDALKTLVVIGHDGKRTVAGLEFSSSVSRAMGRALAGLPLDADAPVTHFDMLASLKGAQVEIEAKGDHKGALRGRVIDVLPAEKTDAKDAKSSPTVLLAGDDGALRKLSADDVLSVRPTDPSFATRLDAALDAQGAQATRAQRNVRLLLDGPVTLGYVAETPVWRTTYRVLLGDEKGSTMQGWALLHNDTDEHWKDVRVTLVNGRPDSFLFPLAAPRYARRELVTPENRASTVPQLLGKTVDAMWGDHIDDASGAGGLGLSGVGEGGGGMGYGYGMGSIGTVGHGAGVRAAAVASSLLSVGDLASVASAEGVEAGALFSYTLTQPLELRPHGSALVPFVAAKVDAERITWLASPNADARAAVRFVNSTAQTLPSGPIAFYADGGFAGESALDRLKPSERRFLQFGADLDVELGVEHSSAIEATKRLTYERDAIEEHYLKTTLSEWTIKNRGGQPRKVYVGLDVVRNAKVTGADSMDYDAHAGKPVATVAVPARGEAKRTLTSVEGLSRTMSVSDLKAERLAQLATEPDLSPPEKAVVAELAKKQRELEDAHKAREKTKADIAEVTKDTDRLREYLKAAGGERGAGAGGQSPLVARVLAAEDKLAALRKKLEADETDHRARLAAVRAAAEKLPSR